MALLEIERLIVAYGKIRAVQEVTLELDEEDKLALVGESGSGKTTLALAVLQALPGEVSIGGSIRFGGRSMFELPASELRKLWWKEIALVPQAAMNSFNPVIKVGRQVEEAIRLCAKQSRRAAGRQVSELFEMVGLPVHLAERYPHQLSGGQKQRAMLAMAVAGRPKLLILDEPTTALDVICQEEVFVAMNKLQQIYKFSLLLISHDLALVGRLCHKIAVMYRGRLVESGSSEVITTRPAHPYTQALLAAHSMEVRDESAIGVCRDNLFNASSSGCDFAYRCPEKCEQSHLIPELVTTGVRHSVACFRRCTF